MLKHNSTKTSNPLQCDNGGEYSNSQFHEFFASKGLTVRFSCPHTSQHNGKPERMIRTINNAIRTLLFQENLPPSFWVEALHSDVHILNILPSSAIANNTPFSQLFQKPVTYSHLRVFGCLCYPNVNHSNLTKLSPRSVPCFFLGYPTQHSGYRCFDLKTKKVIISRHVSFDETTFPFLTNMPSKETDYNFLQDSMDPSPIFRQILESSPITQTVVPHNPNDITPTISVTVPNVAEPAQTHTISTRSRHGTRKPKQILSLSLHSQTQSPLPKSHIDTLQSPYWNSVVYDGYNALIKARIWSLVPRPPATNIIRSMWLFIQCRWFAGSLQGKARCERKISRTQN